MSLRGTIFTLTKQALTPALSIVYRRIVIDLGNPILSYT